MEINIYNSQAELIESTSPVAGKRCATLIDQNKKVWSNLFLWDPLSGLVDFDGDTLYQLLAQERRKQAPGLAAAMWVTDGVIALVKMIKRVTGRSYGGSMGYSDFGRIVAMAGVLMAIVFGIAAVLVLAPLMLLGWVLRKVFDHSIMSELQRVVDQVAAFLAEKHEPTTTSMGDPRP
jgi:uncharacterized membrane protein